VARPRDHYTGAAIPSHFDRYTSQDEEHLNGPSAFCATVFCNTLGWAESGRTFLCQRRRNLTEDGIHSHEEGRCGPSSANLGESPAEYREIRQCLDGLARENALSLESIVRWGLPFYVNDGVDICFINPGKDFVAFGFGEVLNSARWGATRFPSFGNITSLDAATEAKVGELKKAVA
jgi:hypothetical protein